MSVTKGRVAVRPCSTSTGEATQAGCRCVSELIDNETFSRPRFIQTKVTQPSDSTLRRGVSSEDFEALLFRLLSPASVLVSGLCCSNSWSIQAASAVNQRSLWRSQSVQGQKQLVCNRVKSNYILLGPEVYPRVSYLESWTDLTDHDRSSQIIPPYGICSKTYVRTYIYTHVYFQKWMVKCYIMLHTKNEHVPCIPDVPHHCPVLLCFSKVFFKSLGGSPCESRSWDSLLLRGTPVGSLDSWRWKKDSSHGTWLWNDVESG